MKFYKELMMERLEKEGRADQIDDEVKAIMDDLDGQEADASCWNRRVLDEPVYWVVGKSGQGQYVNELDCE